MRILLSAALTETTQRAEFARGTAIGNLEAKVNARYQAQNAQRFPSISKAAGPVQRKPPKAPDIAGIIRHEQLAHEAAQFVPSETAAPIQRLKTISQVVPPNVKIKPKDAMLRYIEYLRGEAKYVDMNDVMASLDALSLSITQTVDYDYNGKFIKEIHDKLTPLKAAIVKGPAPLPVNPPQVEVPAVAANLPVEVPDVEEQNEVQEFADPVLEEEYPNLDIEEFKTAESIAGPIEEKAKIVDDLLNDADEEGIEFLDFKVAENRTTARDAIQELLAAFAKVANLVVEFDSAMERFDDAYEKGQFGEDIVEANALHTSFHAEHNHVIKTREAHLDLAITELRGEIEINIDTATQQQAAAQELLTHRGYWRTPALAKGHFLKHSADTGYHSEIDYLRAARALTTSAPSADIRQKIRDGDRLFFKISTGEFAVKAADNNIRTFFVPNQGQYYYTKQ